MSEAFGPNDQQRLLERLVTLHHTDLPSSEQRANLRNKLQLPTQRQAVAAMDSEEQPRRLANRATLGLAAAAAGLLVGGAALWSNSRSGMSNSAGAGTTAAPALAASTATPPVRPCLVATGADGLLWDSTRTTPDLIRSDGRFGRWMRQWPEGTSVGIAPASVTPLTGGASGYALALTGSEATGWGAKLGSGLRVHLGAATDNANHDNVRFDCYDASQYAGVRFSARGTGIVFVLLQTVQSVPEELGGTCTKHCWFTNSHAVALTDEIREYRLTWDRFSSPISKQQVPARLTMLEFLVQPQPEPYEVMITSAAFMTSDEAQASTNR